MQLLTALLLTEALVLQRHRGGGEGSGRLYLQAALQCASLVVLSLLKLLELHPFAMQSLPFPAPRRGRKGVYAGAPPVVLLFEYQSEPLLGMRRVQCAHRSLGLGCHRGAGEQRRNSGDTPKGRMRFHGTVRMIRP